MRDRLDLAPSERRKEKYEIQSVTGYANVIEYLKFIDLSCPCKTPESFPSKFTSV